MMTRKKSLGDLKYNPNTTKRLFLLTSFVLLAVAELASGAEENWTGKWFPSKPTPAPGRIPMGVYDTKCDDAKTKLSVDWFDDSTNYTCYDKRDNYLPNVNVRPLLEIEPVPKAYKAPHACMGEKLTYSHPIPTFGTHRPLWARWGEFTFVPKQRWIHNLEHGGIVMLYHPCANKLEVEKLKELVKGCLYRHVITPYNLLSETYPLALVAWGQRLQMSVVSKKVVTEFIKESALFGPEQTYRDGQYDYKFISAAKIVSTIDDKVLCPKY